METVKTNEYWGPHALLLTYQINSVITNPGYKEHICLVQNCSIKPNFTSTGTGTQLIPSVGFPLKYWGLWLVCLQNKKIVVILSAIAYNKLEVANLQTTLDMWQCVY